MHRARAARPRAFDSLPSQDPDCGRCPLYSSAGSSKIKIRTSSCSKANLALLWSKTKFSIINTKKQIKNKIERRQVILNLLLLDSKFSNGLNSPYQVEFFVVTSRTIAYVWGFACKNCRWSSQGDSKFTVFVSALWTTKSEHQHPPRRGGESHMMKTFFEKSATVVEFLHVGFLV